MDRRCQSANNLRMSEEPGLAVPTSVKARRKKLKWTQERLASEAGVSTTAIHNLEKGKNGFTALEAGYRSQKRILGTLDWKADTSHSRILRIPIACDTGSPEVIGISIIGTAFADEPNQRVTFQMCMDFRGTDYRVARIDWRPRQPHTNRYGLTRGLTLYTSIHDFPENAALGVRIMQSENLPIVKPIEPEPPDFPALTAYLRDTFRLDNAQNVPVPPWSPLLV